MHELKGAPEPGLHEQLKHLSDCDLVLVEGYKREAMPKLEIHRRVTGEPLLYPQDRNIVAIATDEPITATLPVLDLNDYDAIVEFIIRNQELA